VTDDPSDAADVPDGPGSAEAGSTNDRARESVEHLQAAARELIASARAALDVAEDLVDDPEVAASLAGAVGSVGDVVRNLAGGWRMGTGPSGNGGVHGNHTAPSGHGEPEAPDSGVERIPVT
jgi:hypothetical protein